MGGTPSHDGEAKDLMTPAQFSSLLRISAGLEDGIARREPLLAAFVLGGLYGLRTAEARRLTWGGIDLKAGRIELDRNTTRKRGLRGRFIELEPAALAWLRTLTPAEKSARVVKLTDKNFRDARLAIARAAKLPGWSHNIMRRSFASHHLALNEDGAKTAAVLGHTDAETTFAKYRVPAKRCDGEAWFAIFPPTPEKPAALPRNGRQLSARFDTRASDEQSRSFRRRQRPWHSSVPHCRRSRVPAPQDSVGHQ